MNGKKDEKEMFVNYPREMKNTAYGVRRPRQTDRIVEAASVGQPGDSPARTIKQSFHTPSRREILRTFVSTFAVSAVSGIAAINASGQTASAAKLDIVDRLSPFNKTRPARPQTRYIVLHTTEGKEEGSLNKLVRFGEAHYFVALSGRVYRIIDKAKIATHSGRSMWEGRSTLDNHSLGIEVSGYHNKDITAAQYEALKELLRQLKSLYNIPDERVLTHSMVAYGRPNQFHKENHRGRKRCGMIFADPKVRARLNLKTTPDRDPDVDAGRLMVADRELYVYLFPSVRQGSSPAVRSAAVQIPDKPSEPVETPAAPPVEIAASTEIDPVTETAAKTETVEITETAAAAETAVVMETAAAAKTAAAPKTAETPKAAVTVAKTAPAAAKTTTAAVSPEMPVESLEISLSRTAWQIARERYNSSSTIYEFPDGRRLNGSQIADWGRIPTGTRVILGETDDPDRFEGFLEIGKDGDTPQALAGSAFASATTIYLFPDGLIRTGAELQKQPSYRSLFKSPPKGTRLLVGYVFGGRVTSSRRPSRIAGVKWNYPSTYYRYPDGRILSGDDVKDSAIPVGTLVFFQE